MKKLLVLGLVLAMSSTASAALSINIIATDRIPVMPGFQVSASDVVTIQIVATAHIADLGLFIGIQGPEAANLAGMVNNVNSGAIMDITGTEGFTEYTTLVFADLAVLVQPGNPAVVMNGVVVDYITFHPEGYGDVTITAFDPGTSTTYGSVVVQTGIPEPMTVGLLGLGGLFLRRRRREKRVASR